MIILVPIAILTPCQAYPMRIAIVDVIGQLIRVIVGGGDSVDTGQAKMQLNGLYDLLMDRAMDISSYVRTRVLKTLMELCRLEVKFPKQRLTITRVAVDSLQDKAATVRKSAVSLLTQLVGSHPYGLIHGGTLKLQEWEQYYQEMCDELKKLEDVIGKGLERPEERDEQDPDDDGEDEQEEGEEENAEEGEPGPSKRRNKGKQR